MGRTIADAYLEALQHLTALVESLDGEGEDDWPVIYSRLDAARAFLAKSEGFLVPMPSGQWGKV